MLDSLVSADASGDHAFMRTGVFLPPENPSFCNPDFDSASLRVLIVRLSKYADVDRSTPHLVIACEVRSALPDAFIDMAFFPSDRDRRVFDSGGVDWITGVYSLRSGREFDVILVSNSFLLELINLPVMLMKSSLPVWSSERGAGMPLIIMGGSNVMAAQAVMRENGDCMADALFFGEGERCTGRILKSLSGADRRERLNRLKSEGIPGLWVAGEFPEKPVEKAVLGSPAGKDAAVRCPVLNSGEAATGRLQISYGCPAFCSFCFEGYDRKPYREMALDDILDAAVQLKINHGCRNVDLYSFNFNTYSDLVPLIMALHKLFFAVSFKSQRVDILSGNPGLLPVEIAAGKSSFTLGIEGISRRCRAMLHKSLSDAGIDGLMERMFREKVREVKLFYILTGHENADDIAEFGAFVRKCRGLALSFNSGIRVIFSFGMLVRMPGTPMQFDALKLDRDTWRGLSDEIESICESAGFEYRMASDWQEYAVSQIMAVGGYWLWRPVMELAGRGYFYDGRLSSGYGDQFREWMAGNGHWNELLLGAKDVNYPFALSFVASRVSKSFLYEQYLSAISCVDDGYCLGQVGADGTCLNCGACVDGEDRRRITGKREQLKLPSGVLNDLAHVVKDKARMPMGLVFAVVPESCAGGDREWINAAVMRRLLEEFPGEVANVLSVQELFFLESHAGSGGDPVSVYGEMVFGVKAWDLSLCMTRFRDSGMNGFIKFRVPTDAGSVKEPVRLKSAELTFTCHADVGAGPDMKIAGFLRDRHIPFTLLREGDGYRMALAGKKRDKDFISECKYRYDGDGWLFHITAGQRFEMEGLRRCFGGGLGAVKVSNPVF